MLRLLCRRKDLYVDLVYTVDLSNPLLPVGLSLIVKCDMNFWTLVEGVHL